MSKLHSYFHAHEITIVTEKTAQTLPTKSDALGKMVNWEIELSEFRIKFAPKTALEGKAFTYIMVDNCGNGLTEAKTK